MAYAYQRGLATDQSTHSETLRSTFLGDSARCRAEVLHLRCVSDLLDHLAQTTALSKAEAAKVVAEVTAYFAEPTEALVRRRHRELQAAGLANPAIFERLADELASRLVAAPTLSARQLRRIVYG